MADLQLLEGQINGGALAVASTENVGTKRQRRPSVRLGEIGDQPYDAHVNRRNKQWKLPIKDSIKSSKTRPLTNLSGGGGEGEYHETLDGEEKEGNLDSVVIGSWKVKDSKSKRGSTTKRVRSNWISNVGEGDDKFSGAEDVDDGFRGFDPEGSESPFNSLDNMEIDRNRGNYDGHRRDTRVRVSEGRENHDGVEFDGPSDTARNWNNFEKNGVRVWLNELGLGRYAPVFEIHEVDDEVLPMLTMEDLKDMGINAVGSRRKMYCSIQKLGKIVG